MVAERLRRHAVGAKEDGEADESFVANDGALGGGATAHDAHDRDGCALGEVDALDRLVGILYMTLDGIFGVPLDVAATYIILFTIYGAVLEYSGAFLQLYREEGWYLERTVHFIARVGLDYVKKKILEDHELRRALWARLQAALEGEPDPWFEQDKASVDTRQFDKLAAAGQEA